MRLNSAHASILKYKEYDTQARGQEISEVNVENLTKISTCQYINLKS